MIIHQLVLRNLKKNMEIKFTDRNNKDLTLKLEDEEVQFFVEFAVAELLKRGALSLSQQQDEKQLQLQFLEDVPAEHLASA